MSAVAPDGAPARGAQRIFSFEPSPVRAWWTTTSDGDQRGLGITSGAPLPVPAGRTVRRVHQVHGGAVVAVTEGPVPAGATRYAVAGEVFPDGDVLVARDERSVLAVLTADCAPVALGSPEGIFSAVHAGWRGLAAGVVEHAVEVMRAWGASKVSAGVGQTIGPCCYEFAGPELASLVERYGEELQAVTSWGTPALDLTAGVARALAAAGVDPVHRVGGCTGCGPDAFSYRRRGDAARQALLVWRV